MPLQLTASTPSRRARNSSAALPSPAWRCVCPATCKTSAPGTGVRERGEGGFAAIDADALHVETRDLGHFGVLRRKRGHTALLARRQRHGHDRSRRRPHAIGLQRARAQRHGHRRGLHEIAVVRVAQPGEGHLLQLFAGDDDPAGRARQRGLRRPDQPVEESARRGVVTARGLRQHFLARGRGSRGGQVAGGQRERHDLRREDEQRQHRRVGAGQFLPAAPRP